MSLINKMLRDLEKRDAFLNENQDMILDGLYSAYDLELNEKRKRFVPFSIFLIFIICSLIIFWFSSKQENILRNVDMVEMPIEEPHQDKIIEPVSIEQDVPDSSIESNVFLKLEDELVLENNTDEKKPGTLNRIESIKFEINETGVDLIMNMPKDIDYLVYGLSNPNRTVIEIENTELGFALENLEPVAPIVAIRYSINEYKRFKLVLESDRPLSIKKSTTSQQDNQHSLVVAMEYQWDENNVASNNDYILSDIVEKQVQEEQSTVYKGELIKIPVSQNTNAYAEKLFQQAYAHYKKHNISESLKLLNMALDQDASHVNARSTLALVLSQQGHMQLAYSVLNEGLIQFPNQLAWIKMLARLYLNDGKIVEAKNLLAQQTPDLSSNPDYYALQAAILQKLNEHDVSARIYRDLLQVNPSKAVWWVGLGISLESLKRYDDALYAYQKAFNNPALAADSRQFISQRLKMLSNLIKDEST